MWFECRTMKCNRAKLQKEKYANAKIYKNRHEKIIMWKSLQIIPVSSPSVKSDFSSHQIEKSYFVPRCEQSYLLFSPRDFIRRQQWVLNLEHYLMFIPWGPGLKRPSSDIVIQKLLFGWPNIKRENARRLYFIVSVHEPPNIGIFV